MAMVNCPSCKKIVNDASKKCPNCGAPLNTSLFSGSVPGDKKLRTISSVFMYGSAILLFLEFFDIAKTYVGGLLLGIGFFIQGLSIIKAEKAKGYKGKSKAKIIMGIGVVIFIAGIIFIYIDLITK